jgi:hypothetical protein
MYIKISAVNKTFTFCKLIFNESNKHSVDFAWINNKVYGYSYNLCMCSDVYCCKNMLSKQITPIKIINKDKNNIRTCALL